MVVASEHDAAASTPIENRAAVALFKFPQFLTQSTDAAFDKVFDPDVVTPHAGIYRCDGCGRELTCLGGQSLPPPDHHGHTPQQGPVKWRLVVSHP